MRALKTFCFAAITFFAASAINAQTIAPVKTSTNASFRGLSVVDDSNAWVSGSKGTVGTTTDGGNTWHFQQVKGYEKSDFRDIEAISNKEAVMMSSGTPAVILRTIDGGLSWNESYKNIDSAYFLDAMDFVDATHGYILGDPIKGKFLVLQTSDGGKTWTEMNNAPAALPNEAAFAASGTCLRAYGKYLFVVTGGSNSRLLTYDVSRKTWGTNALPLTDGAQSTGAFSMAQSKSVTIVVGGNYAKDKRADSVAYLITKGEEHFPGMGPAGYQSCVESLNKATFLSTGTSGSNITSDSGENWKQIDTASYNTCRKAKRGKLILVAGDRGKIGILKF